MTLIQEQAGWRLCHQLREYFPAALGAFEDLDAPDALDLLARAPDPARARRLTRAQISAALKRARRRDIPGKATAILTALRGTQPVRPPAITAAYAATVRSLIAVITTLNEQAGILQGQVEAHFGQHPDAEIYLSQPGRGPVVGPPPGLGLVPAEQLHDEVARAPACPQPTRMDRHSLHGRIPRRDG